LRSADLVELITERFGVRVHCRSMSARSHAPQRRKRREIDESAGGYGDLLWAVKESNLQPWA